MRIIKTCDVLVIGSGGAGLRAAIEARNLKKSVLLVSKAPLGLASCTASAAGGFRLAVNRDGKPYGKEKHLKETLAAGRFLNDRRLVEILVNEGAHNFLGLKNLSVPIYTEDGHGYVLSSRPPAGVVLTKKLADYALKTGVRALSNTFSFDLILNGDAVVGALCFKRGKDDVIAVTAKSTILATGGYASLYPFTDNPPLTTGDGIALAYKAGASLQDMEFIQFVTRLKAPGDSRLSSIPDMTAFVEATKNLVPGGVLFNSKGEPFMERYDLMKQTVLRDNLAIAVGREIEEGRGVNGAVIFDLTQALPEAMDTVPSRFYGPFREYAKRLSPKTKLPLFLVTHYTMGGIRINEKCETGVNGLYAAGEVTGGIHGANRLGGNALTEVLVFGTLAGQEASKNAEQKPQPTLDPGYLKQKQMELKEILRRPKIKGFDPRKIKESLKRTVNENLSPVRNEDGIKQALEDIKQIREEWERVHVVNMEGLRETFEADFMLIAAEAIARAALTREESRGPHYRVDHPRQDDKNWLVNLVITRRKGEMKIRRKDVIHE